jgi:DNA-binding XRE family transcriptional regulator
MGILEIIAEARLGKQALKSHPKLRTAFKEFDSNACLSNVSADQKRRIADIVDLCFEYERESDSDEKANILSTLEEIAADEPLELPTKTLEDWEEDLKINDPEYAEAHRVSDRRIKAFLRKYFSLRAKAGFETQQAVADASGLKRSYIATIETGEHLPQQKTLQKLAKAFKVDVTDLFG